LTEEPDIDVIPTKASKFQQQYTANDYLNGSINNRISFKNCDSSSDSGSEIVSDDEEVKSEESTPQDSSPQKKQQSSSKFKGKYHKRPKRAKISSSTEKL